MKYTLFFLCIAFINCTQASKNTSLSSESTPTTTTYINPKGTIILDRYDVPEGFEREHYKPSDYGYFLQHLPLKPYGSIVLYYNLSEKLKPNVYNGVVDLPIGTKDLHQCADAAMRLRADYLYQQKRYSEIAFNFLSDGQPRYYENYVQSDYSYEKYWKYMEYVFSFANTASLKNQLKTISEKDVAIGDILIQQGVPYGHAVIVVDIAKNKENKTIVLLAQSYMPAQQIQILDHPNGDQLGPWYLLGQEEIITPEWKFSADDWKTW